MRDKEILERLWKSGEAPWNTGNKGAGDVRRYLPHKNVFLTGHTGFKGSWLALWLSHLGANVPAMRCAADRAQPFALIGLDMPSVTGDVRDGEALALALNKQKPDIIFHLAAQAIVRRSYREPLETVASNILGTANLLEAARACPSVRAIVIVTSDKCYENREWPWGYREIDRLGGYDPTARPKPAPKF
jgi:CDP-glucose 4,6-dehydratase